MKRNLQELAITKDGLTLKITRPSFDHGQRIHVVIQGAGGGSAVLLYATEARRCAEVLQVLAGDQPRPLSFWLYFACGCLGFIIGMVSASL